MADRSAPVTVALSKDASKFAVSVPGVGPGNKTHTLLLPVDMDGLRIMFDLLFARRRYDEDEAKATLGTPAAPTQAIVDAWLRNGGRIEDDAVRAEQKLLKDYGQEGLDLANSLDLSI